MNARPPAAPDFDAVNVDEVSRSFGRRRALTRVSFHAGRGTILGIPLPRPGIPGTIGGAMPGDYRRAVAYLKALSNTTGGRFYTGDSLFGIAQAFTWIAEELGRQYSLGYYPTKAGKDGERRQIKVKTTEADLVVKARDSYIYSDKTKKFTQATRLNP